MNDVKDLLELAAGDEPVVTDSDVAADVSRARRATSRRRSLRIGATAGVAALVLAALTLPMVLPKDPAVQVAPPAQSASPWRQPGATATAKQVLLMAADVAEQAKPTEGKYYRVRTAAVGNAVVQGRNKERYTLRVTTIEEEWTGVKGGTSYIGTRNLGAQPATPADEAAWRRAGSPTRWLIEPLTGNSLQTTPDEGTLFESPETTDHFAGLGYKGISLDEVLALPSDPDKLRPIVMRAKGRGPDHTDPAYLLQTVGDLLRFSPVLPKVRAAALRLLATVPGTVVRHNVSDPLGRKGTAVDYEQKYGHGTVRMLFDPTGKYLGTYLIGDEKSVIWLSSEWSTETPHVPDPVLK
ncbi:CU044_5270 family protein [Kribbella sp. NPDC026611]|uniref:CU044_5270 family protein n=1 Tax=Kribbella sp. NPDC026611 TaxID=3154911 RepID=UPI0033FB97F5